MAGILTDADIAKTETAAPLTDADIAKAEPTEHSALGDIARGALSKLNPVEMVKGMADTVKAGYEHPIDSALRVLAHPYQALTRAKEALVAGKPEEAAAHVQSALDPTGFATEESLVKGATPGQRATGLGELLGTGLAAYLGAKAPSAAPTAANAAKNAATAVVDAAGTPLGRAALGVVSPRTMHSVELANKLREAFGKAPQEAPPAVMPTGTGSPTANASVQQFTPQFEEMPPAPAARPFTVQSQPSMKMLDDIAKGTTGKPFSALSAERQGVVRDIAAKFAKPVIQMPANGQPTVAGAVPLQPNSIAPGYQVPAQPVAPIETAPQPRLPQQPIGIDTRQPVTPKPTVGDAAQALADELAKTPAKESTKPIVESLGYKMSAQAEKAKHIAETLNSSGITAEDMAKAGPEHWKAATEAANAKYDVNHAVPSKATMAQTLFELRKLERVNAAKQALAESMAQ